MKYHLLLFVLLLKNISCFAQGCDSIVIKYDRVQYDPSNPYQNSLLTVDTFSNHILRSTSFGGAGYIIPYGWSYFKYETFTYDSLNRLQQSLSYYLNGQSVYVAGDKIDYTYDSNSRLFSQSTYQWNNSHWVMYHDNYIEHYYRSDGKDSLQIFGVDTSGVVQHMRIRFIYNVADSLIRKATDIYDGSSWHPNNYIAYSYTPNGNTYILTDSLFYFNNTWNWYQVRWTTFNLQGDSIHSDNVIYGDYSGYKTDYSYSCNHQIEFYSGAQHGGSIAEYSATDGNTLFDSICRPISYSNFNRSNNGANRHKGNYYYVDCHHMVLSGLDTIRACMNDTVHPNLFQFGGKAPFHYSWNPANGLSSTTILNPEIFVNGDRSYTLTVIDSNGINSTHTIFIAATPLPDIHLSIVNIDSLSTCSSAILQAGNSNILYYYDWSLDGVRKLSYPPNYFQLIATRNGTYAIRTIYNNCWNTDTIHVNTIPHSSPAVSITRYCDDLIAHANTGISYQWFNSGILMPGETNDSLHLTGYGTYSVRVTDAAGCSTTQEIEATQNSYTSIFKYETCADTCNGILGAQLGYNIPVSYLWSTGDTTQSISGVCVGNYSVLITDANGCVYNDTITMTALIPENHILSSSNVPDSTTCSAVAGLNMLGLQNSYTFLWDNGDQKSTTDSLCVGWHYLTSTNQRGCKQFDSVFTSIHVPDTNCHIDLSATSSICTDACDSWLTVSGTGQAPLNFTYTDFYGDGVFVCPGTYHAILIDGNGCIDSASLIVTPPPSVSVIFNITPQALPCSTQVSAVVTSSAGPFDIYWSNGSSDSTTYVCPGVSVFTLVDTNFCYHQFPFIVFEQNCSVKIDTISPSCNGDCDGIAAAIVSGTPPFSYDWSLGDTTSVISNLCAGNYSVTVTDSLNCIAANQVLIKGPSILNAGYKVSYTTCADSCIVLAQPVGGSGPFSYLWCDSTTAQNHFNCTNNCMLNVTDANGCHSTVLTTIPVIPPIDISLSATNAGCPGCDDGSILVNHTGGIAPFHISIQPVAGVLNVNHIFNLPSATYFVCITDSTGCMECDTIQVGVSPIGINVTEQNSFSPAPNPFSTETIFLFENISTSTIIITDVLGKVVRRENINGGMYIFRREDLNAGIYFFSIIENNKTNGNGRLVIIN